MIGKGPGDVHEDRPRARPAGDRAGVPLPAVGRSGVRGGVVVLPGDGVSDLHDDGPGLEREPADRHSARLSLRRSAGLEEQAAQDQRPDDPPGPADRPPTIAAVPGPHAPSPAAAFALLAERSARLGLTLDAARVAVCERFAAELIERNTSVNLTAITDPGDIADKHFLDSFTAVAARTWEGDERVVDIGSGAGFPGLALRIALPSIRLTCVESVGKKARFIEEMSGLLGLGDVTVRNERAEGLARVPGVRGTYDVGTARAVGSLAACAEYLLPLLRTGGEAIVWKGRVEGELAAARGALAAIGGELVRVLSTEELGVGDALPGRHLVVLRKVRPTPPAYPRPAVEASRRPW